MNILKGSSNVLGNNVSENDFKIPTKQNKRQPVKKNERTCDSSLLDRHFVMSQMRKT